MEYVLLVVAFGLLLFGATFCGMDHTGLSFVGVLQKTLIPLTTKDFWFPPCALCWATRVVVLGIGTYLVYPALANYIA